MTAFLASACSCSFSCLELFLFCFVSGAQFVILLSKIVTCDIFAEGTLNSIQMGHELSSKTFEA